MRLLFPDPDASRPPAPPPPRWCLGLDLGKRQDPTALAIARYDVETRTAWIVHLERHPLETPYTVVVARVAELCAQDVCKGKIEVAFDCTGVGEPVWDVFRLARLGAPLIPIVLTGAGERAHRDEHGRWMVPKTDVITAAEVMLQSDPPRLRVDTRLALAPALYEEFHAVRAKPTAAGRLTYDHETESGHGDLMIATALTCWAADRRPKPRISFLDGGQR